MTPHPKPPKVDTLECCPPLLERENCESLDIRYRLPFRPQVGKRALRVEVTLHFRLTRCSKGLSLGDLAYTTTLLPAEKVRIFSSDRHTRFSYDTETNLAYRHEATSEESFFMAGMARAVSDLSIVENSSARTRFQESSVSGGGGASLDLFFFEIGGGASGSSYSASSASDFARSVSRHAEVESRHVEVGVRATSATSIGEVERRTHAEGESESQYESSSRLFQNNNRCHAVTYYFYKLDKVQQVTFELVAVERRVDDPLAPAGAYLRPSAPPSKLSVMAQSVPATAKDRLTAERNDRISQVENLEAHFSPSAGRLFQSAQPLREAILTTPQAVSSEEHQAALAQVDGELAAAGLVDQKREEPGPLAKRLLWTRTFALPTPGVMVKGCLDDCDVCEESLKEEIRLEVERKRLENEMLAKQIQLLEKSQEYRCCPAGEAEVEEPE